MSWVERYRARLEEGIAQQAPAPWALTREERDGLRAALAWLDEELQLQRPRLEAEPAPLATELLPPWTCCGARGPHEPRCDYAGTTDSADLYDAAQEQPIARIPDEEPLPTEIWQGALAVEGRRTGNQNTTTSGLRPACRQPHPHAEQLDIRLTCIKVRGHGGAHVLATGKSWLPQEQVEEGLRQALQKEERQP